MEANQMLNFKPKISIIGCGNVGVRYAYALSIRGLARQIIMIDTNRKRLEGEVMDLSHGAPYISPVEIVAGNYPDIKNSDLIIITAGVPQKSNQTRLDLAEQNVKLYKEIIPKIMEYASSSIFLVVSNPLDILTYAALKFSGKPVNKVFGTGTALDTARFRYLLGKHCKIDPHNVHAYILGEHGDSEFAVWSSSMIGGIPLRSYCNICADKIMCNSEEALNQIFVEVKDSAYKIIERKNETSYGIGLTLVRITTAILNDENAILPVSSYVEDYFGINDVCISLPAVINRDGIREILKIDLNAQEQEAFKNSAKILKKILKETSLC